MSSQTGREWKMPAIVEEMNGEKHREEQKRSTEEQHIIHKENLAVMHYSGLLVDVRLADEGMNFLWDSINNTPKNDARPDLVANNSGAKYIHDMDNTFYKNVLAHWSEYLFYKNWNNYYDTHIAKKVPVQEFVLKELWVNHQKQHEFNPPHNHRGTFSFVIFMKIPYHWKEQHALPISEYSNNPCASDFQFILPTGGDHGLNTINIHLSSDDEGRMLFFPSRITHQVFPFYNCEEERITISGNIMIKNSGDYQTGPDSTPDDISPLRFNVDANEY